MGCKNDPKQLRVDLERAQGRIAELERENRRLRRVTGEYVAFPSFVAPDDVPDMDVFGDFKVLNLVCGATVAAHRQDTGWQVVARILHNPGLEFRYFLTRPEQLDSPAAQRAILSALHKRMMVKLQEAIDNGTEE